MSDIERKPGYEPPSAERGEAGREEVGDRREGGPAGDARRAENAERSAMTEATGEIREAKERIADMFWARPKQFIERVVATKLAPYFKRFLGKFSQLDDDAMATDALKRTRDRAAKAAGDDAGPSVEK